jgi:hypothetical protein
MPAGQAARTPALHGGLCKRMKQISYWKECETSDSAPKIEIVTNAMLQSPLHPGKQVQRFADMSENDHHQARRAEQLKE